MLRRMRHRARRRFARQIGKRSSPFYLVCGYGETGALVVQLLSALRIEVVIVERDLEVVAGIESETHTRDLPALIADARDPAELLHAGLRHSKCLGVVAVTGNDHANVEIALAATLLNAGARVVCRASGADAHAKLASPQIAVIDPFETFGAQLALAIHRPHTYLLREALRGLRSEPLPVAISPPRARETSGIVARCIVTELSNPLLRRLLALIDQHDDPWAETLYARLHALSGGGTPATWVIRLDEDEAPAVHAALCNGRKLTLGHLQSDPQDRNKRLSCIPLLLERAGQTTTTPEPPHPIMINDSVLFAGAMRVAERMQWILGAENVLDYIEGGADAPNGLLFQWWARRRLTDPLQPR
ncbi:MAG: potassium channel family protein [Candidatus Binatia bacterium]